EAGRRIYLASLDQARLDDVHRNARRAFPHDDLGRRELCSFQATAELQQAVGAEFSKQLDVLQKSNELFCFVDYDWRHESLWVLSLSVLFRRLQAGRYPAPVLDCADSTFEVHPSLEAAPLS